MSGMFFGTNQIKKIFYGNTEIKKVYNGNVEVWSANKKMPVKGDIINFNALANGTNIRFRVLSISGNVAKLLEVSNKVGASAFNTTSKTAQFDNGNYYQDYTNSTLSIKLNNTYYNTLATNVKAAIIPTNRVQSCYTLSTTHSGSETFCLQVDDDSTQMNIYYTKVTQKTNGELNCFALDIDDIVSYFNNSYNISTTAIKKNMFDLPDDDANVYRFSSAAATNSTAAWMYCTGNSPGSYIDTYYDATYQYCYCVAAFNIDLSNIDFQIEG